MIRCSNCKNPYPEFGVPYRCPICGGVYDIDEISFPSDVVSLRSDDREAGVWKYRRTFPFLNDARPISLGEGGTPLVWSKAFDRKIGFKLEYMNPTGSFKDRGTSLLASFLVGRAVTSAIEDSSGNAGTSFSAYAARADIKARIFVPETTSATKRRQIAAHGAEVVSIPGPRSNASNAVRRLADDGEVYASHAFLPHGIPGFSTIAYEMSDQLGDFSGTIIVPCGQGGLVIGIIRGFIALQNAGMITQIPKVIAVQARQCAPIWSAFQYGASGLDWVTEGETVAEGVRIRYPLRGDQVLNLLSATDGDVVVIDEQDILSGQSALAGLGLLSKTGTSLNEFPGLTISNICSFPSTDVLNIFTAPENTKYIARASSPS